MLIITYYWPPSGGAGVQRWLKFSKYLAGSEWDPVIITVDPDFALYPALDESLEGEIPENIIVFRTRATDWFRIYGNRRTKVPSAGFATNRDDSFRGKLLRFIRGNFFIPDPRRGWNRFAFKKASELIVSENIKNVITTSPPHSTQLIGLKLKKRFPGINWIADLRDPWTDIYYYKLFYPCYPARKIDAGYERAVLLNADIITTVGPALADHFGSKLPGIENKLRIIHNGYDDSDFEDIIPSTPQRFTISYTGTLSDSYSLDGFINAVAGLRANGEDFLIKFTGHISENLKSGFIAALGKDHLEFNPYADHKTVIIQMASSSIQLLVLANDAGNKSFLPGKLFEYIAARKPILCLGPVDGDTSRILEKGGYGKCFNYEDSASISSFILKYLKGASVIRENLPEEFSRRTLAGKISLLLK